MSGVDAGAAGPGRGLGWRRGVGFALLVALGALLLWDLTRAPQAQVSAAALLAGIDLYQSTLSSRLDRVGIRCRFEPTCSHYAEEAIRRHGAARGVTLAAWRILRCGPWTPVGTSDPI